MNNIKLNDMIKGWIVGDFEPTLYKTSDIEVAIKKYNHGDQEKKHYHKIAKEITVVAFGRVKMNDQEFCEGDIIILEPGEVASFESLENNTITVVIKTPSAKNDKYLVEQDKS